MVFRSDKRWGIEPVRTFYGQGGIIFREFCADVFCGRPQMTISQEKHFKEKKVIYPHIFDFKITVRVGTAARVTLGYLPSLHWTNPLSADVLYGRLLIVIVNDFILEN